jgi:hypothetical protein
MSVDRIPKKTKGVRIPPEISARIEYARLTRQMRTCLDWPDENQVQFKSIQIRMNILLCRYGQSLVT